MDYIKDFKRFSNIEKLLILIIYMFIKTNLCLSVPIACLNHSHDCDVKVSKGVCCGLWFRGWFTGRGRAGEGFVSPNLDSFFSFFGI